MAVENRFAGLFWNFGFSLFELGQFPKSVSILGWMGHGVHEQVDVIWPIFEVIEWFKVVEAIHELVEILVEWGIGWFRNPNVSRFRWRILRFPGERRSHPNKPGVYPSRFPADSSSRFLLLILQSAFSYLNTVDEVGIYSIDPWEYITRPFL